MAYQVTYPTLAELQAMTAQDIFNRAAGHLLKQGKRAAKPDDEFSCLYRGPAGTACAVGALIPEDLYTGELEGYGLSGMLKEAPTDLADALQPHKQLLWDLQGVHDNSRVGPERWPQRLEEVAARFGLQMIPLEGLSVIPMGTTAEAA